MKHAKKLVSIPETEYQALLGMLDPLKREKLVTEQKISETFSRPDLSELDRGLRYQSLQRKRRLLNKRIEEKPIIRVMLEPPSAKAMPTDGIHARPAQQVQEIQQQAEVPAASEVEPIALPQRRTRTETVNKYHALFDANKLQRLRARVDAFKEYFGINERGEILSNKTKSATRIKNSDYEEVLEYLTGNIELPEDQVRSIATLVPRLLQDDGVKQLISAEKKKEMTGAGRKRRRYVVDLSTKPIKTPITRGLKRFKPLLWSKIPL
jgi:hypothetical protein